MAHVQCRLCFKHLIKSNFLLIRKSYLLMGMDGFRCIADDCLRLTRVVGAKLYQNQNVRIKFNPISVFWSSPHND